MAPIIKSMQEREKIRETGHLVAEVLAELRGAVRPGMFLARPRLQVGDAADEPGVLGEKAVAASAARPEGASRPQPFGLDCRVRLGVPSSNQTASRNHRYAGARKGLKNGARPAKALATQRLSYGSHATAARLIGPPR